MKKAWRLLPIDGSVVGDRYWNKLREGQFIGDYGISQIQRYNRQVAAALEAAREVGKRTALAGVAIRVYNERWRYLYSQSRPYSLALFSGGRYYDCSSMVTVIYHEAGQQDPNALGFSGFGWTGTLDSRNPQNGGRWVDSPKTGDLAMYGPSRYGTTHVAIHISPDEVVSFGSNPVRRLPVRYRGDWVGSRSWL
jgi:hypothetical protein